MRVLHIIDSEGLYGAEAVLLDLSVEQKRLGIDAMIANMREGDLSRACLEYEARRRGIEFHVVRAIKGPDVRASLRVLHLAESRGVDVIHSHGYKPNILIGFIPRRIRQKPIITTIHGWTNTGGNMKMRLYEWLDVQSLRYMDAIVVVNKALLSDTRIRRFGVGKASVIQNGILFSKEHLENWATDMQEERLDDAIIDFCRKGWIVGSVGRLSEEKGFSYLVEAIKLVLQEGVDVRLAIIGEGGQRKSLEALVNKLGLRARVLLPGYKKNAKYYLSHFSIFALSSVTEGLPITVLEAMEAGVPILASRVGGVPEALDWGKAGELIEASDVRGLAQGILRLLTDPLLCKRKVDRAKNIVTERYSSGRMACEYVKLYERTTAAYSGLH